MKESEATSPTSILNPKTDTLQSAALVVLIGAGSWYMLGELVAILRPLLLAIFLAYVLMPTYTRLRRKTSAPWAISLLGGFMTILLTLLASGLTLNLIGLADEIPEIKVKVLSVLEYWQRKFSDLPYIGGFFKGSRTNEDDVANWIARGVMQAAQSTIVGIPEALATGLYLLFLLLESTNFRKRVELAFGDNRSDQILQVFGRINSAIISYLKAKVKSSLILSLPIGLVLLLAGVNYALLWCMLTLVLNFIPYLGPVLAFALPVGYTFLQHDVSTTALIVTILILLNHILSAALIEPMLLGKAVGMSPLVILFSLSIWGVVWGIPGMFLAVPLTVVLKITLENIEFSRPVALMLGDPISPHITKNETHPRS